jgi:glucan endo-1,3-alpha-glucosidase
MGTDPWQLDRVADAYDVARSMGSGFALFPSFDMGTIPCREERDGDMLRDFVNKYHDHSNQLEFKGNPLVSTFGGQGCYFGQSTVNEGWRRVLKRDLPAVHFLASFFMDPGIYGSMNSADGAFSVSQASLLMSILGADSQGSGTRRGRWGTTTSQTNMTSSSGSTSKGGRIWLRSPLGSSR